MVGDQPVTVDWTIESRGGKTLLRVTQSSIMSGEDWEQEYFDSTNYGWGFILLNLRHYLEQHAGEPRLVAWPKQLPRFSQSVSFLSYTSPRFRRQTRHPVRIRRARHDHAPSQRVFRYQRSLDADRRVCAGWRQPSPIIVEIVRGKKITLLIA